MSKNIQKEFIKNQLLNNKSYYSKGKLKKGYNWLANKFNVNEEVIREVVKELKVKPTTSVKSNIKPLKQANNSLKSNHIDTPGIYWITGCTHAPFHNKRMYESTFNFLSKEIKLSGVILDGDILDLHSISRHDIGKVAIPGVTLDWEYKEAAKFIDEVDSLKAPIKKFLYGNHEDRYLRLLNGIDASKYGDALKSPEEALDLIGRGYDVYTDFKNDCIKLGKFLEINHGEFVNVHTAKKTIDTYRTSVLYFHTHRYQIYTEGNTGGFNMGFGGDINSPVFNYATKAMKNSWMNGSALVTIDSDGYYHVQPLLFINNKLIINGKQY